MTEFTAGGWKITLSQPWPRQINLFWEDAALDGGYFDHRDLLDLQYVINRAVQSLSETELKDTRA